MKLKPFILGCLFAASPLYQSHAATLVFSGTNYGPEGWEVDAILDLEVNGYGLYDVHFYEFDQYNVGELIRDPATEDISVAFWGDSDGAYAATVAVTAALGTQYPVYTRYYTSSVGGAQYDRFYIPFAYTSSSYPFFYWWGEYSDFVDIDNILPSPTSMQDLNQMGYVFAKLTPSVSAVPVPAAVWLFGSGLIGLITFARGKR